MARKLFGTGGVYGNGFAAPNGHALAYDDEPRAPEKLKAGPLANIPFFLPFADEQQSLHETAAMRIAYRRMLSDPTVKAASFAKIFGVASLDLRVVAADQEDKRQTEVADFVQWNLNNRLHMGFGGLVWSVIAHGLIDGHSVCEKVWGPEEKGKYRGKTVLRNLKPKDVDQDLVLEVDAYRNIVAIQGLRYNAGMRFDPRDFVIWAHCPLYDLPTGMSDFRAAYFRWWVLDSATKLRAQGCESKAFPFVWGTYPDPTKQRKLEDSLKKVKSQNWAAVPENVQLQVLELAGASSAYFKSFCDDMREEIAISIEGATLQMMAGKEGAQRGDTRTHKDTADLRKWWLAQCVTHVLNDEEKGLIPHLVDLNYAEVDEYPRAVLGGVDDQELKESLAVDQGLQAMGWRHKREDIGERYGRKEADGDDDALEATQPAGLGEEGEEGGNAEPGANGAKKPPGGGKKGQGGAKKGAGAAKGKGKAGAKKFAEHDVSGEPRDKAGKWTHGEPVRVKPSATFKGAAHPRAGHEGTIHADGLSGEAAKEDSARGIVRIKLADGKVIGVKKDDVESHVSEPKPEAPKKEEVFGKPIVAPGDTGTSGLLPGVTRVKFHSGEHVGRTATVVNTIPMRYLKEETTHQIKIDGLQGRIGETTVTTAHLKKHATSAHASFAEWIEALHPRGQVHNAGSFATAAHSGGMARLARLARKGHNALATAKAFAGERWAKLPRKLRWPVAGFLKVTYAGYMAGHAAVHAVAMAKGATDEQATRISNYATTVDMALGGTRAAALTAALGMPALAPVAAMIPIGSLAYLAWSTAVDPLAVLRAARGAVRRARTAVGFAEGHDVSGEARNAAGEWTKGDGGQQSRADFAKKIHDETAAQALPLYQAAWKKGKKTGSENLRVISRKQMESLLAEHGHKVFGGSPGMEGVDRGELAGGGANAKEFAISKLADGRYSVVKFAELASFTEPSAANWEALVDRFLAHDTAGTGAAFEACLYAALDTAGSLAEAVEVADKAAGDAAARFAEHDVSGEKRDQAGKWTVDLSAAGDDPTLELSKRQRDKIAKAAAKDPAKGFGLYLDAVYFGQAEDRPNPGDADHKRQRGVFERGFGVKLATPKEAAATPKDLQTAFDHLDVKKDNLVSLVDLRQRFPDVSREQFDAALHDLRRQGVFTVSAAEGRHGITAEEREASIPDEGAGEHGARLLWVSRKKAAGFAEHDVSGEARDKAGKWTKGGTGSEAFKAWFGNSKVVDAAGEPKDTHPLEVYHGSRTDFSTFDKSKIKGASYGWGFYFSEDKKEVADAYARDGKVMACWLSISRPFDSGAAITGKEAASMATAAEAFARKHGLAEKPFASAMDGIAARKGGSVPGVVFLQQFMLHYGRKASAPFLQSLGFDGVKVDSDFDDAGNVTNRHWVAFEPTQIKSVDNAGAFDPKNDDVRFAEPRSIDLAEAVAFLRNVERFAEPLNYAEAVEFLRQECSG